MTLETEKAKFPKLHNFNEMYTPPEAVQMILPFLPKDKVYREACYGMGHFAQELTRGGVQVVGHKDIDCLTSEPEQNWDIWITNPPWKGNKKFIKRAIDLGKPFVFLVRLEHIGGVEAKRLLDGLPDTTILIPERRVNYITPKMLAGEKVGGAQVHSVFIVHGLGIGKQLMYI